MTEETKTPKAEATPPPEKKRRVSEETPVPTALELKVNKGGNPPSPPPLAGGDLKGVSSSVLQLAFGRRPE